MVNWYPYFLDLTINQRNMLSRQEIDLIILYASLLIKSMKLLFSGEYKQNLCLLSDPNCQPCPTRFPSCLGLSDGKFPHPSHLWGRDYIMCFHNRTIEVVSCDNGYFNPRTRRCSSYVDPG